MFIQEYIILILNHIYKIMQSITITFLTTMVYRFSHWVLQPFSGYSYLSYFYAMSAKSSIFFFFFFTEA